MKESLLILTSGGNRAPKTRTKNSCFGVEALMNEGRCNPRASSWRTVEVRSSGNNWHGIVSFRTSSSLIVDGCSFIFWATAWTRISLALGKNQGPKAFPPKWSSSHSSRYMYVNNYLDAICLPHNHLPPPLTNHLLDYHPYRNVRSTDDAHHGISIIPKHTTNLLEPNRIQAFKKYAGISKGTHCHRKYPGAFHKQFSISPLSHIIGNIIS